MNSKRKQYVLALCLLPAALLLSGLAVQSARAACTANGNGSLSCTDGASTISSGPTITVGSATNTSGNVYAIDTPNLTAAQGASISINGRTIVNNNQYPAGDLATAGNNVGIYLRNLVGGTGDLSLTMSGTNSVTTARGTGILVNNRGTGTGTATISGILTVHSTWNKSLEGQDGVEVSTVSGKASLDMSQATGSITVDGGGKAFCFAPGTLAPTPPAGVSQGISVLASI